MARRRTARPSVAGLMLVCLLAVACSGGSDDSPPASPPPPPPPPPEQTLAGCPEDQEIWFTEVSRAQRDKRLDDLHTLLVQLHQECPDRWQPLWAIGQALTRMRSMDKLEQAKEPLEQALALAEAAGDPVGVSRAAVRLGFCYRRSGDLERGEAYYRQGLEAAQQSGNEGLIIVASNNLAGALMQRGNYAEALINQKRALDGWRSRGATRQARNAAYNMALLLKTLGNLAESRETLEALYEETAADGDTESMARISNAIGNLHRARDDRDAAREWFLKVTDTAPQQAIRAEYGLGRLDILDGDYPSAQRRLQHVVEQQQIALLSIEAGCFLAEIDLLQGDTAAARKRLEAVIAQADERRLSDARFLSRTLLGRALLAEGKTDAALELFREAIEVVEETSRGLDPRKDDNTAVLRERSGPYVELAATLAAGTSRGAHGEILEVMERAHARELRRILGQSGAGDSLPLAELETIRAGLASGELLIDFLIGEERGVVLAIAPDGVHAAQVPGWSKLSKPLRRYRTALRRPLISAEARLDPERDLRRDIELGKQLRRQLLGPIAEQIDAARRLYIVPDQELALLPFAALPLEDSGSKEREGPLRFLGDELEIALLPMAATPPGWDGERGPVLLAGDPLPDPAGEFLALPLASEELTRLAELWKGETITQVRGPELLEARMGALPFGEFRTIHLATHAVASSLDPRRCAVILSNGERLGTQAIREMQLGPTLVVLSACQTGEGEVTAGEGVRGLSWAFLSAGARGVAASLWSVEDRSTADLMVAFHQNMKAGNDPVRSMTLAQRQLGQSRRHPAYWAPFVVIVSPG